MIEWKAGDRAMVEIVDYAGVNFVRLKVGLGSIVIHTDALHPLPEPSALTALEREFIEAWFGAEHVVSPAQHKIAIDRWEKAKNDLRTARTPPDPWEELKAAWFAPRSNGWNERMDRAIAAIEARKS